MAEKMEIDTDFKHAEALRNANELAQIFDVLAEKIDKMHGIMTAAVEATQQMAAAEQNVAVASKDAATGVEEVGKAAENASEKVKDVGEKTEEAGRKGGKGIRELKEETSLADRAVESLGKNAIGMIAGFASLHTVVSMMKEFEETTRKIIEARRELGENRLTFDQAVQGVVDNFGFMPDQAGIERARKIVLDFQKQTGGTPGQAVETLSMAESLGFNVSSGPGAGMDVATELGKFAARTKLDSSTAGDLLKIASLSGVKDRDSMVKFLAQIEAAGQGTSITNPADFTAGLVKAAGPLISQGVPLDEAMAYFAAAATGETSADVAATRVQQLTQVVMGGEDTQKLTRARAALKAGFLTGDDIDASRRSLLASPERQTALQQQSLQSNERLADVQRAEERADRERARAQEDIAAEEKRIPTIKDPNSRARAQTRVDRMRQDYEREYQETQADIANRRQALQLADQKAAESLNDEALVTAYSRMPLSRQLQAISAAVDGMTGDELKNFVGGIAPGETVKALTSQLSPAGRATFAEVSAGVQGADVEQYLARNRAYQTTTIAQAAQSQNANTSEELLSTPAGQEIANILEKNALSRQQILESQGEAASGMLAGGGLSGADFSAYSDEGLKAQLLDSEISRQFSALKDSLSPEQQQRYGPLLKSMSDELSSLGWVIESPVPGSYKLRRAQAAASKFGSLLQRIQGESLTNGEQVPQLRTEPGWHVFDRPAASSTPGERDSPAAASPMEPVSSAGPAGGFHYSQQIGIQIIDANTVGNGWPDRPGLEELYG